VRSARSLLYDSLDAAWERTQAGHPSDWPQIAALYDRLLRIAPTPAAALDGRSRSPWHGARADADCRAPGLDRYHLLHAARADLLRRANCPREAARAYHVAVDLTRNERERAFLARRLAEVRQLAGID
jgi:RNA polymerase sigma-70 factor (ECF subfamily)